jgi:hypothetical protein
MNLLSSFFLDNFLPLAFFTPWNTQEQIVLRQVIKRTGPSHVVSHPCRDSRCTTLAWLQYGQSRPIIMFSQKLTPRFASKKRHAWEYTCFQPLPSHVTHFLAFALPFAPDLFQISAFGGSFICKRNLTPCKHHTLLLFPCSPSPFFH